jgi:tRNA nucleotidyltransferase/poly(A) polymerase
MERALEYLSEADTQVLARLRSAGEAWIVGGWVRDSIIGRPDTDLDIATSLLPAEVKELFPRSLMVGEKYGTVVVRLDEGVAGEPSWEVTTLRSEGTYGDGRRPDEVIFGSSIEDDLARRDFTINAMAIDADGNRIDPHDGVADLRAGVLRSVGDARERLGEDGLRIMRAFRFLDSESGVRQMEPELRTAVMECSEMLERVSRERIGAEMQHILTGGNVGEIIAVMSESGTLERVLSGIRTTTEPAFGSDFVVNLAMLCSAENDDGNALAEKLRGALVLAKEPLRAISFLHDAASSSLLAEIGSLRRFKAALPEAWQESFISYSEGLGRLETPQASDFSQ